MLFILCLHIFVIQCFHKFLSSKKEIVDDFAKCAEKKAIFGNSLRFSVKTVVKCAEKHL